MGAAERDSSGRATVGVSCTCTNYSNHVTGKTVHKAWREARKVHAEHVKVMGEQ